MIETQKILIYATEALITALPWAVLGVVGRILWNRIGKP